MTGSDKEARDAGSSFGGNAASCDSLAFETVLSSPKPKIISALVSGDILDIQVHTLGGIETVVALYNNNIAGGLVRYSDKIKVCVEKGFKFEAEVREINGAQVKIFVRPC